MKKKDNKMKIGIDLDGVVFDSEKEFRVYSELYDMLDLKQNSKIDNKELKFQKRFKWTKEEIEGFLNKYHKQIIVESNFMPGAKRVLKLLKFYNIEIEGIPVESDVSEQPVNDEIYIGAKNRVKNLKKYAQENDIEADLFLSIETGINNSLGRWMITNIAVIEDNDEFESYGTSPSFPIPDKLVEDIINTDLNQVMNSIFEKDEERHNRGGGIQLLTHNKITRIDLTEMAFIMALTKYINEYKWR